METNLHTPVVALMKGVKLDCYGIRITNSRKICSNYCSMTVVKCFQVIFVYNNVVQLIYVLDVIQSIQYCNLCTSTLIRRERCGPTDTIKDVPSFGLR